MAAQANNRPILPLAKARSRNGHKPGSDAAVFSRLAGLASLPARNPVGMNRVEFAMSVNQYETLSEAIAALKRRGYTVHFEAYDGLISTPDHRKSFNPEEVAVREHHRFEGTSDPDEMAVLYAIETTDGTRGILIDAFGVYADPKLGRLITTAQMHEYNPSL